MPSVPSAARRLSAVEAAQLGAIAEALGPGFVLVVTAPHGQLEIVATTEPLPLGTVFVADPVGRAVMRWPRCRRQWPEVRSRHSRAVRGSRSSPSAA